MITMDRMEGNGRSYVREEFQVCLYKDGEAPGGDAGTHETVTASAYICHPNNLSQLELIPHPPSARYLEVLINGAKHHKLDKAYVEWLENHPFTPLPTLQFTPEQLAIIESRTITQAELEDHNFKPEMDVEEDWTKWNRPLMMSCKGVVFDIRPSKYSTAWKKNNAGRDLTLFCAGRVAIDNHSIPKTISELQQRHKDYINATLVDYAAVYPILGHMEDRDKYDF